MLQTPAAVRTMTDAAFKIEGTFVLPSRSFFVLAGEIVSGRIQIGMVAEIRINPSLAIDLVIVGVEAIDHAGGKSQVGLCIRYDDDEERELLEGLNIGGEIVAINQPPPESPPSP